MTINYPALIRGWDTFTPREKFRALYEYRQVHPYKPPRVKAERVKKVKPPKPEFNPPPGYYQTKDLTDRLGRKIATIKRYIASGNVRSYRACHKVAYCEYDLILAKERAEANAAYNRKQICVRRGSLRLEGSQ